MRYSSFKTFLNSAALWAGMTVAALGPFASTAQADSPFHTGVWQLSTEAGPRGLVVSDWLVFENGLPKRWLFRRAGTDDANQFDFYTRSIGTSGFSPVGIRFSRKGDDEMTFIRAETGKDPFTAEAKRLSTAPSGKSCLSVENKGDRLIGEWTGTTASTGKSLRLSKTALTIDDLSRIVSVEEIRVGRVAILEDGKPLAFFTDAGGDYAVLQWFRQDVTPEVMRDTQTEIMDFRAEDIFRSPNGTCDRQIEARLKTMK